MGLVGVWYKKLLKRIERKADQELVNKMINSSQKEPSPLSLKGRCKWMFNRRESPLRFISRFSVIHTLTYTIFGIMFMLLSDYFSYFESDEIMSLVMKPADALTVRLAVPAQLIRGAILGSAIYPFRSNIIKEEFGWLKLAWLMFALTAIGAVITGPGSIEGILYTNFPFDPLTGYPEIILQILAFSIIFVWWSNRKNK